MGTFSDCAHAEVRGSTPKLIPGCLPTAQELPVLPTTYLYFQKPQHKHCFLKLRPKRKQKGDPQGLFLPAMSVFLCRFSRLLVLVETLAGQTQKCAMNRGPRTDSTHGEQGEATAVLPEPTLHSGADTGAWPAGDGSVPVLHHRPSHTNRSLCGLSNNASTYQGNFQNSPMPTCS